METPMWKGAFRVNDLAFFMSPQWCGVRWCLESHSGTLWESGAQGWSHTCCTNRYFSAGRVRNRGIMAAFSRFLKICWSWKTDWQTEQMVRSLYGSRLLCIMGRRNTQIPSKRCHGINTPCLMICGVIRVTLKTWQFALEQTPSH